MVILGITDQAYASLTVQMFFSVSTVDQKKLQSIKDVSLKIELLFSQWCEIF